MGFLGTSASFSADFNLVIQIGMGIALLAGMQLARKRRFRAHKYCQSTVLLLNLLPIALIMLPSFRNTVLPNVPGHLSDRIYAIAVIHGALGAAAELLGLYIVLIAGTNLLPRRLRFHRYKRWMRTELVLWWVVVLAGITLYLVWYVLS